MSKVFLQIKNGKVTNRIVADSLPEAHDDFIYHDPEPHNDCFKIGEEISDELIEARILERAKKALIHAFEEKIVQEMQIEFDAIAPESFKEGDIIHKIGKLGDAVNYPNGNEAMLSIGKHEYISKPLKEIKEKTTFLSKKYYELVKKLGDKKQQINQAKNIEALSKIAWIFLCFFLALQPAFSQDTGYYVRPGSANFPANPVANAIVVIDSTTGIMYYYNGSTWAFINSTTFTKNNYTATADPTSSNDTTQGYSVGSFWLNTTTGKYFICKSNTMSTAVWYFFANASTAVNNFSATTNPSTTNDINSGYSIGSLWCNTTTGVFYCCSNNSAGAAVWNFLSNTTFNPSQLLAKLTTGDILGNSVLNNLVPAVPVSSSSLTFPASVAYINGLRVIVPTSTFTYAATNWTFDFVEPDGTLHHIAQAYSTVPPSDPGVLFEKVVTNGSAIITEIDSFNTIAPVLQQMLQPPPTPTSTPLPLCADSSSPSGVVYEKLPLSSLVTSSLSQNPLQFVTGIGIVSSPISIPSQVVADSGSSAGAFQFDGTSTLSFGPLALAKLAAGGATTGQVVGFAGGVWGATTLPTSIPQSAATGTTNITLTGTSATTQSLNAASGNITVNLPAISATPVGKMFVVDNSATTGTNTVTTVLSGSDAITGTNNLVLANGQVLGLICDGIHWVCFASK